MLRVMRLRAWVAMILASAAATGCADPPGEAVVSVGDGGPASSGGPTSGPGTGSAGASEGSTAVGVTDGGPSDGGPTGGSADTVAPGTSGADTDAGTSMGVSASSGGADTAAATSIGTESTGVGPGSTSTGEPACDDPDEADEPVVLEDVTCDTETVEAMGIMDGPTSPDLWTFHGVIMGNDCGGEAQPKVTVTDGSPLRVCIWSVDGCDVTCPGDAQVDNTMGNGCCRNDDLEIPDLECMGNDSSDVLVAVSDEDASCRPYTLQIRY